MYLLSCKGPSVVRHVIRSCTECVHPGGHSLPTRSKGRYCEVRSLLCPGRGTYGSLPFLCGPLRHIVPRWRHCVRSAARAYWHPNRRYLQDKCTPPVATEFTSIRVRWGADCRPKLIVQSHRQVSKSIRWPRRIQAISWQATISAIALIRGAPKPNHARLQIVRAADRGSQVLRDRAERIQKWQRSYLCEHTTSRPWACSLYTASSRAGT